MAIFRVTEAYDGKLPIFNVIKKIVTHNSCGVTKDKVIKSFDTYEEANRFCDELVENSKAKDSSTPCGEEDPCS